jgi:hypothetical protein
MARETARGTARERLKWLWVRIGATMKRLRWTSVGRWWLAWVSGATTTFYHTLRPTASTRQHGPRSLAAIIWERGRGTCLRYRTSIQADHVISQRVSSPEFEQGPIGKLSSTRTRSCNYPEPAIKYRMRLYDRMYA